MARKKPDDRRMRAWEAFVFAHSAVFKQLARELEQEENLPIAWYEVLLRLSRAPGRRMRMQELADGTFFSPSGVTRLVDRMEVAGLVERIQCATDKRGYLAVLTDGGLERLRAASPLHLRGIQEHFAKHLSDDEADAVADALEKVLDSLRARPRRAG
jgi:DNA-binding MarR family transcriptional regulator